MTEIPMPDDYGSQIKPEKEKGCCDKVCECWCQLLGALILIFVLMVLIAVILDF